MAIGFKPQCKCGLVDGEARLDEKVAERQNPELPLFCDAKDFLAIPRIVAQRFLAFSNETLSLPIGFLLGDVEGSCRLGEVWDEEVA